MKRLSKRVSRKQYNLVFILLCAMTVFSAYFGLDYAARKVEAANEFISPISDAAIIEVEKIKEVPVEVQTLNSNVLDLVDYIHEKESNRGRNTNPDALHNLCKSQGKSNEFGYGGMRLKICFENETMAKARVTLWVAEHLVKYEGNVGRVLCQYNLGQSITNCPYKEGYVR